MSTRHRTRAELYVTLAITGLLAAAALGTLAWYSPAARPQIPLHKWLAAQPEVAEVEHATIGPEPRALVVHVRDLHFVPRDLFAADVRSKHPLTDALVEGLYRDHLDAVEGVQREHHPLLKRLLAEVGHEHLWVEGLTADGEKVFKGKAHALAALDQDEVPALHRQLAEAKGLAEAADLGDEGRGKAKELAGQIEALLTRHRADRLDLGVAGLLVTDRLLEQVLALDDAETLERSRPDAQGKVDPEARRAREEAITARLAREKVAVVVLGGDHDLADAFRRQGLGGELLRVTTRAYREATER